MSEPLTKEGRQKWMDDFVYPVLAQQDPTAQGLCLGAVALHIGRCEATLVQKDEQIAALVDGILAIPEWMSGRSSHICPFCKGPIDGHEAWCLRLVAEAIKEATLC